MIVSRGYAGIVLMAIVFSTVLTLFIIGERPETLVEVIRNDAPRMNSGLDEKYGHAYTIVFRDNFEEVRVKFAWLRSAKPILDPGATGGSAEDYVEGVSALRILDERLALYEYEPERINESQWPEGWPDADELLLLDYSDGLSVGMKSEPENVHTIFLVAMREGQLIGYYEGISDFFPEREWRFPTSLKPKPARVPRSSGSIEFGLDDNRTKYVSLAEQRLFPDLPNLEELPPYGELTFNDVVKDQRLTVLTFIHGRSLGYGWQAELIRVYLDGELELVQVN